jgi:hypothetical protein
MCAAGSAKPKLSWFSIERAWHAVAAKPAADNLPTHAGTLDKILRRFANVPDEGA